MDKLATARNTPKPGTGIIRQSGLKSIKMKGLIIIDSDLLRRIKELDPFFNADYSSMDDLGTSKLFVDVYRGFILYCDTAKSWFCYDGIVWSKDLEGLKVDGIAKEFTKACKLYTHGLEKALDLKNLSAAEKGAEQDRLKAYVRYIYSLGKRAARKTIIEDARSYVQVSLDEFDTQPHLLNCMNGVLDLKTGILIDHSPDLMLSKVANVRYESNAKCERFSKFMKDIMLGDEEKIAYLQVLFGYAMGGTNEREEAYILYGSSTRNGKSTLLDTIKYLLGDYGMNIQPESLAEQKKSGRSASGDIARLNGCRLLQMSEPPKNMKLDVALFKTLTGRDSITARQLYENDFEFTPVFKLFINTNHLPVVIDDTLFSSERIKVITFDRHFRPEEQDTSLKDDLKSPESLSGILNWILQGNQRYRTDPQAISPPKAVREATDAYRNHSDKLTLFLDDFCAENCKTEMPCSRLYEEYIVWCRDNNYGAEGKHSFMAEIRKRPGFRETSTIDSQTVRNVYYF